MRDTSAYTASPTLSPGFNRYDEYGVPTTGQAQTRYGWLGGKQRSAEALGGVVLMGVRLYHPDTGRFPQPDPVDGGSATAYDYCNADPVNAFDLAGTWSWKSIVSTVAKVAEVASFIPGPIGAAAASLVGCGACVKLAYGAVAAVKVAKVGLAAAVLAKKGAVAAAFVGKLGGYAHRAKVAAAEARFANRGFETVAGGSFKSEKKYGNRFPGLVMSKAGYGQIAVNVGRKSIWKAWRGARPVARERRALADLQKTGSFRQVFFVPYN